MNTIDITAATEAKFHKAFELVCPAAHAAKCAEVGLITAEQAAQVDWKSAIVTAVLVEDLDAAGVTIGDVAEAIEFFTATTATVEAARVAGRPWEHFLDERAGFLVQADGYRRGPAGG